MKTTKSKALKGYLGRDPISHRKSSRVLQRRRFKKTGKYTYRGTNVGGKIIYGLGHDAGEKWGASKQIDPTSRVQKYSKNSPSFDEGVQGYKNKAKQKALNQAIARKKG